MANEDARAAIRSWIMRNRAQVAMRSVASAKFGRLATVAPVVTDEQVAIVWEHCEAWLKDALAMRETNADAADNARFLAKIVTLKEEAIAEGEAA